MQRGGLRRRRQGRAHAAETNDAGGRQEGQDCRHVEGCVGAALCATGCFVLGVGLPPQQELACGLGGDFLRGGERRPAAERAWRRRRLCQMLASQPWQQACAQFRPVNAEWWLRFVSPEVPRRPFFFFLPGKEPPKKFWREKNRPQTEKLINVCGLRVPTLVTAAPYFYSPVKRRSLFLRRVGQENAENVFTECTCNQPTEGPKIKCKVHHDYEKLYIQRQPLSKFRGPVFWFSAQFVNPFSRFSRLFRY